MKEQQLKKIKWQFEERKRLHLENQKHQADMISSEWAAKNTASLIDLLYATVYEILNEPEF